VVFDVAGVQRAEDIGDVRKQLVARQRNDACISAKSFDGGEVECTDAINHGLMQCHAGRFFDVHSFHCSSL
jgi:hypothetical protein